jgi:geranylgeranyl pyrophosphate synthase
MAACYQLVAQGHVALSVGQGADLLASSKNAVLSLDDQLKIFEQKTGSAILVALLLGATAGGASKNDLQILKKFSAYFGMAYQIKDDLDEYRESNEHTQVADYPLMLSIISENAPDLAVEDIQIAYVRNDKQQVAEWIEANQIVKSAEELLAEYTAKAYNKLDQLANLRLKLSLYTVLGKIF